jgi:hypothetical protein
MKKEKHFNIREINGSEPIEPWLERGIEVLAKREYSLNITVKVIKINKDRSIDRLKWIVPYKQLVASHL